MKIAEDVARCWWGSAINNGDFICISTSSGYRSCRGDPRGARHFLKPDTSDFALGEAVVDALSRSRFVLPAPRSDVWIHPEAEFDPELYDYERSQVRYKAWVADLMGRYGYKTKRALFKNMKNCDIESCNGVLTIMPMHHEKLEAWSGVDKEEYITLPADSPPAEIGAALRLAFSRCT